MRGFTLIELLVVVSIIGILASIALASLYTARLRARDAQRVSDMKEMQKAIELYFAQYKQFPRTDIGNSVAPRSECAQWGGHTAAQVIYDTGHARGIYPEYITSMPTDPGMNAAANTNCYVYRSNGIDYKIIAMNLTNADIGLYPAFIDPRRNQGQPWDTSSTCTGEEATPAWAVWSTNASRCW